MAIIVYIMLTSVFLTDHLFKQFGGAFRYISWLPELLSVIVLLFVIFRITTVKSLAIHNKYIFLIILFVFLACIGIALNSVQPGAIFAGLRGYCKYLPFFLLPAVYEFTETQIKGFLKFILFALVMQFPFVLYQRFLLDKGVDTGDHVVGTLNISSMLSIALISGIAMIFAFYLFRKINLKTMLGLGFLLFIPITLNETKGSLILLPIAILIPGFLAIMQRKGGAALIPMVLIGTVLIGGFVYLYNQALGQTRDRSITEFVSSGQFQNYLYNILFLLKIIILILLFKMSLITSGSRLYIPARASSEF